MLPSHNSAAAEPFENPCTRTAEPREPREPREPFFVRHPKAKRYIVRVAEDGSVRVTIPRWGSKREAKAFVESQRQRILNEQERLERQRASVASACSARCASGLEDEGTRRASAAPPPTGGPARFAA